jgi:hypothetical protein
VKINAGAGIFQRSGDTSAIHEIVKSPRSPPWDTVETGTECSSDVGAKFQAISQYCTSVDFTDAGVDRPPNPRGVSDLSRFAPA